MTRHLPRGLRARLLLAVVSALAVALAIGVVAFNVILGGRLSSDASDRARALVSARVATVGVTGGHVDLREAPDGNAIDTQVWVFEGTKVVEEPEAATPSLTAAVRTLTSGPERVEDAPQNVRLASALVVADGQRVGTVVAAVSLRPYDRTRRAALIGSIALALALLAAAALASALALRAALRPVARMTRDADAWSERDLDRRFNLGAPKDELTQLAATLDRLLDRLATSLQRERRFTAEISHELRTPLAKIVAEGDFTLRRDRDPERYREVVGRLTQYARDLDRILDSLLAGARHDAAAGPGDCDANGAVHRAFAACASVATIRGVACSVAEAPGAVRVALEGDLVDRILQPVIENAVRYARSRVVVNCSARDASAVVDVVDDGPGLTDDDQADVFEPGARGSAGRALNSDGAGLGLALARRLALTARGEVIAVPSSVGGHFRIVLPVADGPQIDVQAS